MFSENKPIPTLASTLIQHWAHLILGVYNYKIQYKTRKENSNADVLSCLLLPESPGNVPLPGETIFLIDTLQGAPVNAAHGWLVYKVVLEHLLTKLSFKDYQYSVVDLILMLY